MKYKFASNKPQKTNLHLKACLRGDQRYGSKVEENQYIPEGGKIIKDKILFSHWFEKEKKKPYSITLLAALVIFLVVIDLPLGNL